MKKLFGLCMALLLTGCVQPRIQVRMASAVDFGAWKHYAWVDEKPEGDPEVLNSSMAAIQFIGRAVDDHLAEKGYLRVRDPEDAEFLVRRLIEVEPRYSPEAMDDVHETKLPSSGLTYRQHQGWEVAGHPDADDWAFAFGRLEVQMLAPRSGQILWRGKARGELYGQDRLPKQKVRINRLISRMFENVPPSHRSQ